MKQIIPLLLIIQSVIGCGQNTGHQTAVSSKTASVQSITYPYSQIDSKRDLRKNDNSYNEMMLYTYPDTLNIESVKSFCANKKKEFKDCVIHMVVFFDNKQNAQFPNNPLSAGYSEEKEAKHIKAIYTYNHLNGYSTLEYYDKNLWESQARSFDIQ